MGDRLPRGEGGAGLKRGKWWAWRWVVRACEDGQFGPRALGMPDGSVDYHIELSGGRGIEPKPGMLAYVAGIWEEG